jgi:hypothetical protein
MKKFRIPIILLILGLVILILKNKDSTDLTNRLIIALLGLFGIIVFLIGLCVNIKDCSQRKDKFDFLLVATFLIISIGIWAYNNEKFKSKITLFAQSGGYYGFVEELVLRENNKYEFKRHDFKHFYKKHGGYKTNHDTILLSNSGYFDSDMWYFRYSKYLLKRTDRLLIPIDKGKLLMDSSKLLKIKN